MVHEGAPSCPCYRHLLLINNTNNVATGWTGVITLKGEGDHAKRGVTRYVLYVYLRYIKKDHKNIMICIIALI